MAKKKSRTPSKSASQPRRSAPLAPPPFKLLARLEEVDKLTKSRQWAAAQALLTELDRAYPNRPEVLAELVNLAYDTQDTRAYQTYAERLVPLIPEDADALMGLAGAYLSNTFPWLALTTLQRLVQRFPDHPTVPEAQKTIATLQELMVESAAQEKLAQKNVLDVLVLHDRLRASLNDGDLQGVQRTAANLLALTPAFIPALNNLSQAEFALGNSARGIELAEQALALDADNIQALSNLARFQFLSGDAQQANRTVDRLLALSSEDMDSWIKKAEALSILGRDDDVLAVVEEAKQAGFFKQEQVNPILYHFQAAAAARTGDPRLAEQAWKAALKIQPTFALAVENLADLKKPVAEREGAWALPLSSWVSRQTITDLRQISLPLQGPGRAESTTRSIQRFIKKHPEIPPLIPTLLERGDPGARRLGAALAMQANTPELRAALRDFVTGPHGPDKLRIEAAQTAVSGGTLPSGMVSLWIDGEQRELLLIGFTLTAEPIGQLPKAVEALFVPAFEALNAQDFEQGAQLLEKAAKLAPNEPSILNNLAMAYEQMGRAADSQAIQDRIAVEFPDYLFGITGRANQAILDGEFEQARTGLNSLLSRQKLHITEFRALAEGFIRLFLAQGQVEGAESWMKMWEGIEDDHPAQDRLRLHLAFLKGGTPSPFGKKSGWLHNLLAKSLKA